MKNKRNRVVVITGASSGFGRGAALKFAENGDNVVLAARRKRLLKEVAEVCRAHGVEALAIEADVGNAGDVEEIASGAVDKFGHIDVWVNDAGVGTVGRFDEAPLAEHEQVIRTNLLGTMYGTYEALKQFRKQGEGVLINVSSFAGRVGPAYLSSYAASKFGVRGLGMALRQELDSNEENDIHVCTVMPVSFDTPFFEHAGNHSGKPVKPIPPVYDPKEVVDVIVSLADNPQDEVVVGREGKMSSIAHRIAPRLVEKQMGRRARKAQREQSATAPEDSGSVFKPLPSGRGVRGGWSSEGERENEAVDNGRKSKWGVLVGMAVPAAMGVTYLLQRQRHRKQEDWRAA